LKPKKLTIESVERAFLHIFPVAKCDNNCDSSYKMYHWYVSPESHWLCFYLICSTCVRPGL